MKVATCKTVRSQIDELNVGQELDGSAGEHVDVCQSCRSLYESRHRLRSMLADLEPVEAPPDFNFRVRARLASRPAQTRSRLLGFKLFGIPAAAAASLVLLMGAVLVFRTWVNTGDQNIAVTPPTASGESSTIANSGPSDRETEPKDGDDEFTLSKPDVPARPPAKAPRRRIQSNPVVASQRSNSQIATRDFSTTAAPVVKQDSLANLQPSPVFAVQTPSGPLKVSMDFETGGSRTISLPALSFGSERAFSGDPAVIKTSSKGVW